MITEVVDCGRCERPPALCICDRVVELDARVQVRILQHPGEQDVILGSARLATMMVRSAQTVVGLSWPSLSRALDRAVEPSRWAVVWPSQLPRALRPTELARPFVLMTRGGATEAAESIEGIVLLDGTWSQAKSLWWRNPWLLRMPRIILHPREPSIYGRLRREPRRGALSTLEAMADALVGLGEPAETRETLRRAFRTMVQRTRDFPRTNAEMKRKQAATSGAKTEAGPDLDDDLPADEQS